MNHTFTDVGPLCCFRTPQTVYRPEWGLPGTASRLMAGPRLQGCPGELSTQPVHCIRDQGMQSRPGLFAVLSWPAASSLMASSFASTQGCVPMFWGCLPACDQDDPQSQIGSAILSCPRVLCWGMNLHVGQGEGPPPSGHFHPVSYLSGHPKCPHSESQRPPQLSP